MPICIYVLDDGDLKEKQPKQDTKIGVKKARPHGHGRTLQSLFAVKSTALDPILDCAAHRALVHFVGTWPRDWDDVKWKADRARLRLDD
jgi:hypothetical protein